MGALMKSFIATCFAGAVALSALPGEAQTIYPLNRAEIMAGAKFALKVEFPGAPEQSAVKVTIDGQDAASVLGKPATFVAREDGADHSAYWIRDVTLAKTGKHTVEAA